MAGPFELKLRQLCDRAGDRGDIAVRKVVLDVGGRLVLRSPRDKGRFASNWFYSEGAPSDGSTESTAGTEVQGIRAMAKDAAGKVHYLVNNSPQAWVIEHGGYPNPPKKGTGRTINGFSTQAPAGVVGLTVIEFQQIVTAAAAEARAAP
jgi:hypothetical protein